ncbi:MAG: hypothetical protein HHJ12_06600 [Glaciimonas sp.]|nr:hypothetical protein [Glaciimonas sp.]
MSINKSKIVCSILFAALLSACATPAKVEEPAAEKKALEISLAGANSAQKAGQTDQALILLKGATNQFPADKTPWLRIAQIKFDNANYGEAIINALEALQRDPTDKVANSIVTVSGLRLSTKALSNLRSQNALSGTLKSEAQDLTKLLRENLGETVLVPLPSKPVARAPARTRAARAASVRAAKSAVATPKVESEENNSGQANPFGGLK